MNYIITVANIFYFIAGCMRWVICTFSQKIYSMEVVFLMVMYRTYRKYVICSRCLMAKISVSYLFKPQQMVVVLLKLSVSHLKIDNSIYDIKVFRFMLLFLFFKHYKHFIVILVLCSNLTRVTNTFNTTLKEKVSNWYNDQHFWFLQCLIVSVRKTNDLISLATADVQNNENTFY